MIQKNSSEFSHIKYSEVKHLCQQRTDAFRYKIPNSFHLASVNFFSRFPFVLHRKYDFQPFFFSTWSQIDNVASNANLYANNGNVTPTVFVSSPGTLSRGIDDDERYDDTYASQNYDTKSLSSVALSQGYYDVELKNWIKFSSGHWYCRFQESILIKNKI